MGMNDPSVLPRAHASPPHARGPPISITVRDLNVIRMPQRTSSLKSSHSVHNDRKKQSQPPESRSSKQFRSANHNHTPFSDPLLQLKVAKTRRGAEGIPSPYVKSNAFVKAQNASSQSLLLEESNGWKSSEFNYSKGIKSRCEELKISGSPDLGPVVGGQRSSVSRPSTVLSHSTIASTSHQPHYRRESVRRAVTKAISTLNRKKRRGQSDPSKSDAEVGSARQPSVSISSVDGSEDDCTWIEPRDFGVCVVGDPKRSPSFHGAHDVEGSKTTVCSSSGARASAVNKRTPPNRAFSTISKQQDFRESGESLVSQPEFQETPPPHDRDCLSNRRRPGKPTTLRVRLAVKAELKEVNLISEEAIWAVVQVHGEVSETPDFVDSDLDASIAVAIVLDNSRLSTQKDIQKSVLEIIGLAGRLQAHVDRLGVYCTAFSYQTGDNGDGCVFDLLQPLDKEQLSSQLKRIAKQSQDGYHLEAALRQAAEALYQLGQASASATIPTIRRDIIVMSPNPVGLANYTEFLNAPISVHLFNPGLVPFGILDPLPYSSSQLGTGRKAIQQDESMFLDQDLSAVKDAGHIGWVIDATTCISQDCSRHGSHSLFDVIAHSKAQANVGSITNVSISVMPGADVSSIEEVVGQLEYSNLLPGQMISIPIQIRLKSLESRLSCIRSSNLPHLSVSEAITDLELTLGAHLSELLLVQVRYSHSMFPENTRLVAQESCWLQRALRSRAARGDDSRRNSVFECMVQQQLALSLAGLGPPTDALHALEIEFGSKPVPHYCLKFVEAVKRRLRHRILQSPNQPDCDFPEGINSYEAELQDFVDKRQRHEIATDDSPATVVRRRILRTPDTELQDTARKIWQHIRKTSKPERDICDEIEPDDGSGQEPDARMEEIRKMAWRNKRKMSTETLKSLARDYRQFSNELGGVDELGDDVD